MSESVVAETGAPMSGSDEKAPERSGASEMGEEQACLNCGTTLEGAYCHACGQRDRRATITFRQIATYLVDNLFELRRGFLFTLREVALRPGDVARRYVEGERVKFVNPLTMFLVIATGVFLAYSVLQDQMVQIIADSSRLSVPDEAFEEPAFQELMGVSSRQEYGELLYGWVRQLYSYVGLGYCLMIAIVHRLFFSHRTIAENFVFELYVFSQCNLCSTVLLLLVGWAGLASPAVLALVGLGAIALHLPAARHYFEPSWKAGLLGVISFLGGYVLFLILFMVLTFVGGFTYAVLMA